MPATASRDPKYSRCRYFHEILPYGSGPGTDTDLASVMNGEGNRRFDEVANLEMYTISQKNPKN